MRTDLKKLVSCQLPTHMDFELEGGALHIVLKRIGLTSNMQSDSAAFEGWGLCLMAKYPELIKAIVIDWTPLDLSSLKPAERGHYYRFLYRAYKFQKNFPSWVTITPSIPTVYIEEMTDWVLNYPGQESLESEKENPNAEAHLERDLLPLMQKRLAVADHQLPVGLFNKKVSSKPEFARTSRGLSQVDLWSLDKDVLTIYELKNDVNIAVGIVSEVQFYANVMKDLTEHRFNYPEEFFRKRTYYRHTKELADAIYPENKIKKVAGVLLADNLHPLITGTVISMMSENSSAIEYSAISVKDFKTLLSK